MVFISPYVVFSPGGKERRPMFYEIRKLLKVENNRLVMLKILWTLYTSSTPFYLRGDNNGTKLSIELMILNLINTMQFILISSHNSF